MIFNDYMSITDTKAHFIIGIGIYADALMDKDVEDVINDCNLINIDEYLKDTLRNLPLNSAEKKEVTKILLEDVAIYETHEYDDIFDYEENHLSWEELPAKVNFPVSFIYVPLDEVNYIASGCKFMEHFTEWLIRKEK